MRRLRNVALALGLVLSAISCSSGESADAIGSASAAVSTGCNIEHLGEPCDPDPSTPGGECTGVCTISATSAGTSATCTKLVDAGDNDGKICGTAANKKSSCKRTCKTGICLAEGVPGAQAALGVACKPSDDGGGAGGFNTSICDGFCNASGNCDFVAFADHCPRTGPACALSYCDPLKSTTCKNIALPKDTTCTDGNACTKDDVCDGAGKCAGNPVASGGGVGSCPGDGNPCTAEACDGTGKCGSTPVAKDTACTNDFDACTIDACNATGTCTHAARDCDDSDLCTVDGCKSTGAGAGCTHTAKCAGDACNTGSCDATTGACSLIPIGCTDFDPCTTDTCALPGGCVHTPIAGCGDAGIDSGPEAAVDSGAIIDSGKVDTGIIVDSGKLDTGTIIDTGVATDSAVVTDSGSIGEDSGTVEDDTGTIESDTGAAADGSSVDSGDFTVNDAPVELDSGCGCRTTGTSESYGGLSAFALAAIVIARRRRRGNGA